MATKKRYVIERDIPNISSSSPEELSGATAASNAVLSGFPATKITEVKGMIDPTTED